jgi:uncharacterized damage-inducible protein DinB
MSTTTETMSELSGYLASFEREYQSTLRVLKAFPADKPTYKPTERSTPANQVAWTLVMSQFVVLPILTEAALMPPKDAPTAPADWNALVAAFEQAHAGTMAKLKALDAATYNSTIVMLTGPGGASAPMRRADVLWMMLYDTIHHRGQLSVYLRAAGGKVPSIYGPSGDEPWF